MKRLYICFFLSCIFLSFSSRVFGVIFYSTGDPSHNTTAPGVVNGVDASPAWNMQGYFGGYLGTPIYTNYFITAIHIGGTVGQSISFLEGPNTGTYTTVAYYDSPTTDLRIWEISGTFAQYSELYTKSNEVGKDLVVFGRGTQRGADYLGPLGAGDVRGWQWGSIDSVKRWGENNVAGFANSGTLLAATFSSSGTPEESMLTVGDSGGGIFIQDSGVWKLAGINYAVDGAYYSNTGVSGSGVQSAIYNQLGLFSSPDNGTFNGPLAGSGAFYATRISTDQSWIGSVIPEPSIITMVSLGVLMALGIIRCHIKRSM